MRNYNEIRERNKVYYSEGEVFWKHIRRYLKEPTDAVLPEGIEKLGSMKSAKDYILDVITDPAITKRYNFPEIKLVTGRGARGNGGAIAYDVLRGTGDIVNLRMIIQPRFLFNNILLHEIAHLIVGVEHGHDEVFQKTYLKLIRWKMGATVYHALKSEMNQYTRYLV